MVGMCWELVGSGSRACELDSGLASIMCLYVPVSLTPGCIWAVLHPQTDSALSLAGPLIRQAIHFYMLHSYDQLTHRLVLSGGAAVAISKHKRTSLMPVPPRGVAQSLALQLQACRMLCDVPGGVAWRDVLGMGGSEFKF